MRARQIGAARIVASVTPGDQPSLAFAVDHGFTVDYQMDEWLLDLTRFDSAAWRPLLENLQASGLRFVSLAQSPGQHALARAIYELDRELSNDVPEWSGQMVPFETYAAGLMAAVEGVILAFCGDDLIGLAIAEPGQDGSAYGSFLGVRRSHRGQGVALALKVLAIEWARHRGLAQFRSHTNAASRSILA